MSEAGEAELLLLAQVNPRRFALILRAAGVGRAFTAQEFRAAYPDEASSLTRDLNALEAAGLVLASPPASERRQGQRVAYQLAPDAPQRFQRVADLVANACATPPPQS